MTLLCSSKKSSKVQTPKLISDNSNEFDITNTAVLEYSSVERKMHISYYSTRVACMNYRSGKNAVQNTEMRWCCLQSQAFTPKHKTVQLSTEMSINLKLYYRDSLWYTVIHTSTRSFATKFHFWMADTTKSSNLKSKCTSTYEGRSARSLVGDVNCLWLKRISRPAFMYKRFHDCCTSVQLKHSVLQHSLIQSQPKQDVTRSTTNQHLTTIEKLKGRLANKTRKSQGIS